MKILIVEDEGPAARRLVKLVSQCRQDVEVLGVVESVRDGLTWFQENTKPDLILSDIQLSDDLSFELYRQLQLDVPIVFTTAFDEYAIKAFKLQSVDYLLKPIKQEDLQASLDKYLKVYDSGGSLDFNQLLNSLKGKDYRRRFLVYSGQHLIPVDVSDVAYCYSEDGVTFLKDHQGKRFTLSESLDQLEEDLDPGRFFRANRKFILSADSVNRIERHFHQKLKVHLQPETSEEVFISKLKATTFKRWMNG